MRIEDEIRTRLKTAFNPVLLEVVDDGERHRGHDGWRDVGQTHFNVRIRARAFADMGRVARHRAVHAALGRDLVTSIHALALDLG